MSDSEGQTKKRDQPDDGGNDDEEEEPPRKMVKSVDPEQQNDDDQGADAAAAGNAAPPTNGAVNDAVTADETAPFSDPPVENPGDESANANNDDPPAPDAAAENNGQLHNASTNPGVGNSEGPPVAADPAAHPATNQEPPPPVDTAAAPTADPPAPVPTAPAAAAPSAYEATPQLAAASDPVIVEVKEEISPLFVGKIIGKGGEMIRDLQARSGARIDVDQSAPQGHPRTITYRGSREKVDFAKMLVSVLSSEGTSENDLVRTSKGYASKQLKKLKYISHISRHTFFRYLTAARRSQAGVPSCSGRLARKNNRPGWYTDQTHASEVVGADSNRSRRRGRHPARQEASEDYRYRSCRPEGEGNDYVFSFESYDRIDAADQYVRTGQAEWRPVGLGSSGTCQAIAHRITSLFLRAFPFPLNVC